MRARPMRTRADTLHAMRGSRRRSVSTFGATDGPHLLEDRDALLVDRPRRPLVGGLGLAQRQDRAVDLVGQRRGVEVAQHRARVVAGATLQARCVPAMSTKNPSGERGTASSARRRLHARSCEHAQSSSPGVMLPVLSWWTSSTYRYSCSSVHCVWFWPRPAATVAHALDAELGRAQERAVQVRPLRRDPALVAEHAQLRVGARVVREAREEQRHAAASSARCPAARAPPRAPPGRRT